MTTGQITEMQVNGNLTLEKNATVHARLVIRASHITIDGNGAALAGPAKPGDPPALEKAGIGIVADGVTDVTIRNLKVKGFATGLVVRDGTAILVEHCDFSDNYHNPEFGWGELPPRGGIVLTRVRTSVFRHNRATGVWNGIDLTECDDNVIADNDFSHCSNVCAKLLQSCRNQFLDNNLSYGIRIDRAKGEVHARDSTCVLIENGSDNNSWFRNDITHGGDGIFIRVLNGWVSRGNTFIENDTSYANNNCIEAWSPGNTYIRNKANHGSYGFWLGGSDQTVLIGNEASYNGQAAGYHNAPEPGFSHGGIVFVSGSSSHSVLDGNRCHHNNGGGIVFRGDVGSKGAKWRTHHWIVQNNDLHDNRWGIWGEYGDWITLANNRFADNAEGNHLEHVERLTQLKSDAPAPAAVGLKVDGPSRVRVGAPVRFEADAGDAQGRALTFQWDFGDGGGADRSGVSHTFAKPGFYRVGVTAHNGEQAALAFRDLIAVDAVPEEIGTEGGAAAWRFELEGNADSRGKMRFMDDADAVVGSFSLRFSPNPYPGQYAATILDAPTGTPWNAAAKSRICFWIKAANPNIQGWQNAGPVIRLSGKKGAIVLKPAGDGNLLNSLPYSEARWTWMRLEIPLAGDANWTRTVEGDPDQAAITALSIALDSWGADPFIIRIDGLTFE